MYIALYLFFTEMSEGGMMETTSEGPHTDSNDLTLQAPVIDVTAAAKSASEESMVTARSEADNSQQVLSESQTHENSPIPNLDGQSSLENKENKDGSPQANDIPAKPGIISTLFFLWFQSMVSCFLSEQ